MNRFLFIWLLVILAVPCLAQQEEGLNRNAFTVKFFGLSVHLKESPYPEIFPNRLDEKGYITANYGALVGYDRFIVRDVHTIRIEQGLYADCSASLAGFTHIGWRGRIFKKNRHSMNGGIGPTLVYRRDWNRLKGYTDSGYFNRRGEWQYKFYWYAGELEYNYKLKERMDLSVSVVPGLPELVSVGVGVRQRF
jgi:hypothetical protein